MSFKISTINALLKQLYLEPKMDFAARIWLECRVQPKQEATKGEGDDDENEVQIDNRLIAELVRTAVSQ